MFLSTKFPIFGAGAKPHAGPQGKLQVPPANVQHRTVFARRSEAQTAVYEGPEPGQKTLVAGHVDVIFGPKDREVLAALLPELPPHLLPLAQHMLSAARETGNVEGTTLGIQPDKSAPPYRAWECPSVSDPTLKYLNLETKALPLTAPAAGTDAEDALVADLGSFTQEMWLNLLEGLYERGDKHYSLAGQTQTVPFRLWTEQEWTEYFRGVGVHGGENCVGFMIWLYNRIGEFQAPGSEVLSQLKLALANCRRVQDVQVVAETFFKPGRNGVMTLLPTPPRWFGVLAFDPDGPRASLDEINSARKMCGMDTVGSWEELAAEEKLDKANAIAEQRLHDQQRAAGLKHYKSYQKAFGEDPHDQFAGFSGELIGDNSIFDPIYELDGHQPWGESFFGGLGKAIRRRARGQGSGVAAVCFHQDTYPGDITHISLIGFSRDDSRTCISHLDSIPDPKSKAGMVDGLALGMIGVANCSFNTTEVIERITGKPIKLEDTPIMQSLAKTGGPMVVFVDVEDFDAFATFALNCHQQSHTAAGLQTKYGTDPNMTLIELAKAVASGKVKLTPLQAKLLMAQRRFFEHNRTPPPGHPGPFMMGESTNNCARLAYLVLAAGKVKGLPPYDPSMNLAQVTRGLFNAGALPNTDPATPELMELGGYVLDPKTKTRMAHPFSFLCLAFRWSLALPGTPGIVKADVERIQMPNHAQLEAKLREALSTQAKILQRNADSFRAGYVPPKNLLETPPPGPMEPLGDGDWDAIERHLKQLTAQELSDSSPMGATDTSAMVAAMKQARSRMFGIREGGEIIVLVAADLVVRRDRSPAYLTVEIGISTVASARKKGWGLWALRWTCAWARNRGATWLRGTHRDDNKGATAMIASLAKGERVEYIGGVVNEVREFRAPLAEADAETHWLEGFHPGPAHPGTPPKK